MSVSGHGVGSELGSYRIEALLGRGGMGIVYRATDLRLGRRVALKLLPADLAVEERFRRRFLSESRLAASIDHAGIVPIYEAGEIDGQLYIAMRYVEGTDLAALLRREGPLDPARAVALVAQLGAALDAAHAHGLLHRDVKPSNALIADEGSGEHVYLADFGLTKDMVSPSDPTASDHLAGTVGYLAPERISGGPADGRADLYALGCVLFECLTGEVPFPRDSDVAAIYAHLEDEPPHVTARRPGLPSALDDVVDRALAKDPDERWGSGAQLAGAASATLNGAGAGPARRVRVRVARRPPRRRTAALALAAVLAVLAAAAGLLVARGRDDAALVIPDVDSAALIDPAHGTLTADVGVGDSPVAVVQGAGSLWVANRDSASVSRIDLATRAVRQTTIVGDGPDAIAFGAGALWVANGLDGTLSWISPMTDQGSADPDRQYAGRRLRCRRSRVGRCCGRPHAHAVRPDHPA